MTTTTTERTYLTPAETAKMLRKHLKREFPGVDFRVRTSTYSGGASIRVFWTNGPTKEAVDAIAQGYKGGGFDGMIDMAYSYDSYLLPDGTLMVAGTGGTESSMGSVPRWKNEPPAGAKPVRTCNSFVFTDRNYTKDAYDAELATVMAELAQYGITDPDSYAAEGRFYAMPMAHNGRQAAHYRLHDRTLAPSKYRSWNDGGTM